MYGDSEVLIGKWFAANPDKRKDVFLCSKFGYKIVPGAPHAVDSTPEYCHQAIEKTLNRLGVPFVDLYYIHRLDLVTPIEKTMRAMVELKTQGKIKYIGLSECSAESLRRAHAVHPITCVQMEYSPFFLGIESPKYRLLEAARELGVALVAFSPLGKGILGGTIRTQEDVKKPGSMRSHLPWFGEETLEKNIAVVDKITELAQKKGATTAQLTLAWILAQGDDFFAIPGTTKQHRLEENLGALALTLNSEEEKEVRKRAEGVEGLRLPEYGLKFSYADTPPLEE